MTSSIHTTVCATYGNVPLVEPLEYRDDKRIREFVIAIDTSGSVQGDIVQSFCSAPATFCGRAVPSPSG